jgi:hypothetical protein
MFSREARAFLRSGVSRLVRTRPFETVQNNADNSLSLCFCNSWFEISFIVFLLVVRPGMGLFMGKRSPEELPEASTNCTDHSERSVRCAARMASGSVHSEKHMRSKPREMNAFTDY